MDVEMLRMLVSKANQFSDFPCSCKSAGADQAPPAHSHTRLSDIPAPSWTRERTYHNSRCAMVTGVWVTVEGWSFAPVQRWLRVRHHEASDQHQARRFACCLNVEHWLPSQVDEQL